MALDALIEMVWQTVTQAGILALSDGAFSLIPALLNPTDTVVCASPTWKGVAPHWTMDFTDATQNDNLHWESSRLKLLCLQ